MKSEIKNQRSKMAFTLVELLVVITIIVILLALLMPAMDKAVYAAEMAVCGSRLHGIGNALAIYTADHKRRYPDVGVERLTSWSLRQGPPRDLRPLMEPYMSINGQFNCPMNESVTFTPSLPSTARIFGDYNMWFGFGYSGEPGMKRMGDRWGYGGERFSVLAQDLSRVGIDSSAVANSSHPDYDGVMSSYSLQDRRGDGAVGLVLGPTTISWWQKAGTQERGPIDMNALDEGAGVRRLDAVVWNEETLENPRAGAVPQNQDDRNTTLRLHVPLR